MTSYERNRSYELDEEILELLQNKPLLVNANSLIAVLGAVILKSDSPREFAKSVADTLLNVIDRSLSHGVN